MRKLPVCVELIFVYSTLGAIAVNRVGNFSTVLKIDKMHVKPGTVKL